MKLFRRGSKRADEQAQTAPADVVPTGPAPALHMQIVAHTDDDLYFMVPDLLHTVRAGIPVVCVYLTAGEADGRNVATSDPKRGDAPVDFEGYTTGRQAGLRAAYSAMVTGHRDAVWERGTRTIRDGVVAEVNTLTDGPAPITLIYLNLRMVQEDQPPARLRTLWTGEVESEPTLRPTDSPIPGASGTYRMTREGLIGSLVDLLTEYRPTVVRTLDPDPDHLKYDNGRAHYCDHEDHTASAQFAFTALRRYDTAGHHQPLVVESYRGYWNKLWPFNLSGAAFAEKMKYLNIYGGVDGHDCENPALCGDRQLGDRSYNRGYGQSTTYRYHGTTNWLQRQADGRLVAFGVLNGRPVQWTETEAGSGTWSEPAALGTWSDGQGDDESILLPQLDVVEDRKGRFHVLGLKATLSAGIYGHSRDVVRAWQSVPSGTFGTWENLGNPYNPEGNNPVKRREIGMPVGAVDAEGRLYFVTRNFGFGLSARRCGTDGDWSGWLDYSGRSQDGYSTVTTARGTIEIYGGSVGDGVQPGVIRWRQRAAGGAATPEYDTYLPAPAGTPSVLEQPDGRLLLLVRQPQTAWVLGYRQTEPGGRWDTTPFLLGGDGGFGPLAVRLLPDLDKLLVAQRNDAGTVSVTLQPAQGEPLHNEWIDLGDGPFIHSPSIAVDADGTPTVAVIGTDGRLRTNRLQLVEGELKPEGWQTV
ncbi:PIG-L family deacetylase [Kitasatospora sp. NPDC056138]|uniref:PIG-L family deacetylase n=1 Tax=Kitasatospora sp. NPDC056138 TaxID=3345724 RepID=UPI0035D687BF